jgi:hypothetical protein
LLSSWRTDPASPSHRRRSIRHRTSRRGNSPYSIRPQSGGKNVFVRAFAVDHQAA